MSCRQPSEREQLVRHMRNLEAANAIFGAVAVYGPVAAGTLLGYDAVSLATTGLVSVIAYALVLAWMYPRGDR